jgi:hypothetical protein
MNTKIKTTVKTRSKTTATRTPAAALADLSLRDDVLLSTADAARLVGMAPKTLREWRSKRTGPQPLRLGTGPKARVVYRRSVLESWVHANLQTWTPSPVAVRREQA